VEHKIKIEEKHSHIKTQGLVRDQGKTHYWKNPVKFFFLLDWHSPTCCFPSTHGFRGELRHWSSLAMPIFSLHQENFLVLTNFVNEFTTFFKCPPLPTTHFFSKPYPSQSDTEHQCALSLDDKKGSLPRKLHFVYHSLSL